MQACRERRGRRVVKKDRAVIKSEPARQAGGQECSAEYQLIRFEWGIGGTDAGITLHFQAAGRVNDVDQTNLSEILDHDRALRIQFPFLVRCSYQWCHRFGQIGMAIVAPCQLGVLEEGRNPGATGELLLSPKRIGAQFGQNRIGAPAGMAATELENGITERG